MNLGLTEALIKAFPEISPYPRSVVKDEKLINPCWLAGFVYGEGRFFINIRRFSSNLLGYQVIFFFYLTQNTRDIKLMETIIDSWECGGVK